jgi:hypothetical protein
MQDAQRSRHQEKRDVYRALLGVDWPEAEGRELASLAVLSLALDFIPEELLPEAIAAAQRLDRESTVVREQLDGLLLARDQARMVQLYRSWEAEVAGRLGPAGLEELRLRAALLEDGPRHEWIRDLPMSGSELREFYRILLEGADTMLLAFARENGLRTVTEAVPDLEADPVRIEAIEALLGPERAAGFERNRDPDFEVVRGFVQGQHLEKQLGVRLYEARRLALATAAELRADAALDPETRRLRLEDVGAAAVEAARAVLPPEALLAYLQGQAAWHQELVKP